MRQALQVLIGLTALLALAPSAARAQESAQAFTVTGIDVDFYGKTATDARYAAYRYAQRQAWKQLWQRLTGSAGGPTLGDSALDGMVDGIEVESERFSDRRYIGRLGVVFDRVRAGKYLGQGTKTLTSQPMLLMPILDDGGARVVYEGRSPWLKAWARFSGGATPIQYVRADGTSGDMVMLSAWQARRADRKLWATILQRYSTADVLIAEAKLTRTYPGGPIIGLFTARHGPDAEFLGRYQFRVGSAAGLDNLLDAGVRAIDGAYAAALREGRLRTDAALATALAPIADVGPSIAPVDIGGTEALVSTPDGPTWSGIERELRGTPTVSGVSLVSLSLGGTSRIRIRSTQGFEWLAYSLDQRGWRLEPGPGGLRLRRKQAGDPPVAKPLTAEEMEAAANAVTAGTAAPATASGTSVTGAPVPAQTSANAAPRPATPPPAGASKASPTPKPATPAPAPKPATPPKGPANLLPATQQ